MIIGETLVGGTYQSDWFSRGGDAALFATEVAIVRGSLTVYVETKNSEDVDNAVLTSGTLLGSVVASSVGVAAFSGAGARELVRYWYVVSNGGTDFVHFRVLPPAWRKN